VCVRTLLPPNLGTTTVFPREPLSRLSQGAVAQVIIGQIMNRKIYLSKILPCFWVLFLLTISSSGCSRADGITPATHTAVDLPVPTVSQATLTLTPFQPSPTPMPLAAEVNGEGIPLAVYQAELARYQAGVGGEVTAELETQVLDNLINESLLAQAARENGYQVDEALLNKRIAQLGDQQSLADWMSENGYQEADFRLALKQAISAAWMRDQIVGAVSETADQIHARQILLDNLEDAQQVLDSLNRGDDFARLASQYDPLNQGDLGWFPQGYLTDSRLDEALLSLESGQITEIIETAIGYHILQVIERADNHLLTPDARRVLQTRALQAWLENRRSQSDIKLLTP
jgi:peptidyl-prolyl cis-trans isomerase C